MRDLIGIACPSRVCSSLPGIMMLLWQPVFFVQLPMTRVQVFIGILYKLLFNLIFDKFSCSK